MSSDSGINPMRWDCATRGCFNRVKRPKIELLADCLPGRIAFGDIDGIVEINGNLLLLEWKEHSQIATGQRILFQRLTRLCPATVLIVEGDAQDMSVTSLRTVWQGEISRTESANLDELRRHIRAWSQYAMTHCALLPAREAPCN
ncbi:MAG: hypothetical protein IT442_17520 [Phycisphaeraceae bacterium]|nr:hypothetical protein [Phycisphaeraceae bacterium]